MSTMERIDELLPARATEGISDQEEKELNTLLQQHPDVEAEAFDLAAAAVYLELAGEVEEEMPAHLRARIVREGVGLVGAETGPETGTRTGTQTDAETPERALAFPSRSAAASRLGWFAAAASLLLALLAWWPRLAPSTQPPVVATEVAPAASTAGELRQQLLTTAGAQQLAWSATEDAASVGASGDVVWSTSRQEGYMRIDQLEVNDPSVAQYQLWIFDRERDERYPVDGGVFDMPPGGEVIVPIEAKVAVGEPYLFAITVERPGGVVVSDRERIVLVAQPTA